MPHEHMNTPLQFATLIEAFNTSSAARVCIQEDKHGNYPIYNGFCKLCFDQNDNEGTGPAEQAQFIKDKKKLSSVRDWRLAAAQAVEDS